MKRARSSRFYYHPSKVSVEPSSEVESYITLRVKSLKAQVLNPGMIKSPNTKVLKANITNNNFRKILIKNMSV